MVGDSIVRWNFILVAYTQQASYIQHTTMQARSQDFPRGGGVLFTGKVEQGGSPLGPQTPPPPPLRACNDSVV